MESSQSKYLEISLHDILSSVHFYVARHESRRFLAAVIQVFVGLRSWVSGRTLRLFRQLDPELGNFTKIVDDL